MKIQITPDVLRFFWSKNRVGAFPDQNKPEYVGLDKCWLWTGHLGRDGYGKTVLQNQQLRAHHISWFIHSGEIPSGKCLMHLCDVRHCVNPSHLKLSTVAENNADKQRKGRSNQAKGNQLPQSKLDGDKVRQIRELFRTGESQKKIAERYGVCQQAVNKVITKKTWGHIL